MWTFCNLPYAVMQGHLVMAYAPIVNTYWEINAHDDPLFENKGAYFLPERGQNYISWWT